ncbi:MAG: tRNA (adenosine(37)-N6)-threonylcarbamoyltransferase complex ATPase subunit type 1 TsaE [Desulfatiglandales bacterium]
MLGSKTVTRREEETIQIGVKFSENLKKGDVVALEGELGSGKTRFVKGVSMGLGVLDPREVKSPTFSLLQVYEARMPIYHMDYFRLSSPKEVLDAGLDPFDYRDGVVLVEWADKFPELFSLPHIRVILRILEEETREIEVILEAHKSFVEES